MRISCAARVVAFSAALTCRVSIRIAKSPAAPGKPRRQRFRLACHFPFPDDLSGSGHHAHAAQFQRHVLPDCGKILYGCSSPMLEADPFGPRDSIRDSHPSR